jgi:hypothetical protein
MTTVSWASRLPGPHRCVAGQADVKRAREPGNRRHPVLTVQGQRLGPMRSALPLQVISQLLFEGPGIYATPTLATRFARNTFVLRSATPSAADQMHAPAPSIFSAGKHASRSKRYTCIPTIDMPRGLRRKGFEHFMVAQRASRIEGKAEFSKHMVRMQYPCGYAASAMAKPEANGIILINSRDGASCHHSRRSTYTTSITFIAKPTTKSAAAIRPQRQVVNRYR